MDTIEWYNNLQLKKSQKKLDDEERAKNYKPTFQCCGNEINVGHHKERVNYDPPDQPVRKNRIVARCPNAYFLDDDQMVGFDTTEELLEIDFVKNWSKIETFYRYSISGNHLMAEYENGKKWWVIGNIRNIVDLPKWIPVYK